MNKDSLVGTLALLPLFILFAIFLGTIYFRSRYNKAHPDSEKTPAQRLRANVIVWTIVGLAVAVGVYATLRKTNFAPSWTITLYVGWGAFVLGEMIGRWRKGKSDGSGGALFF